MRYREAHRSVFVDSEILAIPGAVVYQGSIMHWDPPNELDALNEADRERIVQNIRHAFESRRYSLHVMLFGRSDGGELSCEGNGRLPEVPRFMRLSQPGCPASGGWSPCQPCPAGLLAAHLHRICQRG
jgi:hypothetical protein